MKVNHEAIYGTTASPFHKLFWGRSTKKIAGDDAALYLHVFDWPENAVLLVPGLQNRILRAQLLASKQSLTAENDGPDVKIKVPTNAPDPICSVIKLTLSGLPQVTSNLPTEVAGQPLLLTARFADIHNPGYGAHARLSDQSEDAVITSWEDERARLSWVFHLQSHRSRIGVCRRQQSVRAEIRKPFGECGHFGHRCRGPISNSYTC
jgi:alpha-L-fucosidase